MSLIIFTLGIGRTNKSTYLHAYPFDSDFRKLGARCPLASPGLKTDIIFVSNIKLKNSEGPLKTFKMVYSNTVFINGCSLQ